MASDIRKDITEDNNTNGKEHNDLYYWIYVAGATIGLGIVDFIFLRPESHLGSFLVLGGWISLVVIFELHKHGYDRLTIVWGFLATLIISVELAGIVGPMHLPDSESIGLLQPARDKTPPNGCSRQSLPEGALTVVAGTNGYVMFAPATHFSAIEIGDGPNICNIADMDRKDGGIAITSQLYSDD